MVGDRPVRWWMVVKELTMASDDFARVSSNLVPIATTRPTVTKADANTQIQASPQGGSRPHVGDVYVASGASAPGLAHHVLYFDGNGDHQITLAESRQGLQKLGLGKVASAALALVLNPVLGKQGSGHYTTTVSVDGLFKNFKPTTTGIFGAGGRFDQERFETLFTKNDHNKDGALDSNEIGTMMKHDLIDPSEARRTNVGFQLLLKVAGDRQVVTDNGKKLPAISKDQLKAFYDGDLFYEIARKHGH